MDQPTETPKTGKPRKPRGKRRNYAEELGKLQASVETAAKILIPALDHNCLEEETSTRLRIALDVLGVKEVAPDKEE